MRICIVLDCPPRFMERLPPPGSRWGVGAAAAVDGFVRPEPSSRQAPQALQSQSEQAQASAVNPSAQK